MSSPTRLAQRERDRKRRREEQRKRAKANQRRQRQTHERERRSEQFEQDRRDELADLWEDREVRDIWTAYHGAAVTPGAKPVKLHHFIVCWGVSHGWEPAKIQTKIDTMARFVEVYAKRYEEDRDSLLELFSPEQRQMAHIMASIAGESDGSPINLDAIRRAVRKGEQATKVEVKPTPVSERPEITDF